MLNGLSFGKTFLAPLLLIGLFAFVAYAPGLSGPFVFDDFPNIVNNTDIHIDELSVEAAKKAMFSTESGPLGRPISLLSFALNYYISDGDSRSFKIVNLLIHIANGFLVFLISFRIFTLYAPSRSERTIILSSLLLALAWTVHPLNLTTVLYVVQRMNSLAALFTLLAVYCYIVGREKMLILATSIKGLRLVFLGFLIFLPLAALSKENGLLAVGFFSLIELAFFQCAAARFSRLIKYYYLLFSIGIVFLLLGFFFDWHSYSHTSITAGGAYALRDFTLDERLMTQSRVLWFYLTQIVLPDITKLTLFHDGIQISRSIVAPITTLYSIFFWGVTAIALMFFIFKKQVWAYFGIAWFLIGHSMESTIFSLELVHEHRNYVPMIGVLLSIGMILLKFDRYRYLLISCSLLLIILFFSGSHFRSYSWSALDTLILSEVQRAPDSSRSHYQLARWHFAHVEKGDLGADSLAFQLSEKHFLKSLENNRVDITGGLAIIRLYDLVGLPPKDSLLKELKHRMSNQVMTSDNSNKFLDYIFCQMEERCSSQPEITDRLTTYLLSNPNLTKEQRVLFLKSIASYMISEGIFHLYIYYTKEQLRLEPENKKSWQSFLAIMYGVNGKTSSYESWANEYHNRFGEKFKLK
ncbi:hypothetical protein [Marinobacter xestospongiae]|uniref:hypothetical protein n=1 Tax=Marinobacter xestospongiae TaxID=994319 RepID=UPI0020038687|nr:hypothetical protein [Marinobacter xestospongiae]MCK7569150.1 hypothetical protein [Marinobacter xestospongiae]